MGRSQVISSPMSCCVRSCRHLFADLGATSFIRPTGFGRTYIPVWNSNFGESIDRYLDEGVQNISLEIYLTQPYSLRIDTAYIFEGISIYDSEGDHIDQVRQAHLTRVYQYEEFDPPSAILTGKSWVHGVDTDLDGTFDALSVIFEVNVSQTD